MDIKVIGSTKIGNDFSVEESKIFSGKAAGICYLPASVEKLFNEEKEKTLRRIDGNLKSGHHSVFGHVYINLCLEGIPKILAMILNNEKIYNTSEKSARYTVMEPSECERKLYKKWSIKFEKKIMKEYPNFEEKRIKKFALENARYLISVFTPATVMEYTVDFRQLNYIIKWSEDYIKNAEENLFSIKLKEVLKEFVLKLSNLRVEGLSPIDKNRKFSLFATRKRYEEFGENYSTNYLASFSQLAQAQRHRTLYYEMNLLDNPKYYVPPIIKGTEDEKEWLKDISSLEDKFPQGMLVNVNERGSIENFVLKCEERLCGFAQLEIANQTDLTMKKYLKNIKDKEVLYNYLLPYSKGARCTFPGYRCKSPCIFGPNNALKRKI